MIITLMPDAQRMMNRCRCCNNAELKMNVNFLVGSTFYSNQGESSTWVRIWLFNFTSATSICDGFILVWPCFTSGIMDSQTPSPQIQLLILPGRGAVHMLRQPNLRNFTHPRPLVVIDCQHLPDPLLSSSSLYLGIFTSAGTLQSNNRRLIGCLLSGI